MNLIAEPYTDKQMQDGNINHHLQVKIEVIQAAQEITLTKLET